MDAPWNHRDFRRPAFTGPMDEGIRELLVKRGGAFHGFRQPASPLDVTGWDGTVWPFAVPILAFQPRVGQVHLPPTVHGSFAARGALVCSFVPRPLDFHPDAVPCPYPHSSVDVDEVIFYQRGEFTSRRGVGPGSISLHPAGIPHGPHPGAYEKSIGATHTNEVAVMLDCFGPLRATEAARGVEDGGYEGSFGGRSPRPLSYVPRLAHSRMATRSAEWRVSPSDLARASSNSHTGCGNRIDLGTVRPVSVPFLGRPRRTWTMPSAATRARYGFGRTLAVPKSTSGISRKEAFDGSLALRTFFISSSLLRGGKARADDPDRRLVDVRVDDQHETLPPRHPHEEDPLRIDRVLGGGLPLIPGVVQHI